MKYLWIPLAFLLAGCTGTPRIYMLPHDMRDFNVPICAPQTDFSTSALRWEHTPCYQAMPIEESLVSGRIIYKNWSGELEWFALYKEKKP